MAQYKCEDIPPCANFQSAICLHCNRRLCLAHITEHNESMPSSIQNLLNEVELTYQQINNEYEKSRDTYNNILTSLNQWRTQQTEKIQQLYDYHLQTIESQQETLNIIQHDLTGLLDRDARQPLKYIHQQQNDSLGIINHIRETIEKAQKHCTQLKWNYSVLPLVNVVNDPKNILSVPNSISKPQSNDDQAIRKRKFPSHIVINLRKYRAFRRLVDIFTNLSSIEQSKEEISTYLKMQGPSFKLPILICSYLTAWHRIVKDEEKILLLNEHISTIKKHTEHLRHSFVTLFGIHAFFYNEIIQENKRHMMAFLLRYFIGHQCLNRYQIISWYNSKDLNGYEGFDGVKQLTAPFIKSLWINNKGFNVQAVSTDSTVVVEQADNTKIKDETQEFVEENNTSL